MLTSTKTLKMFESQLSFWFFYFKLKNTLFRLNYINHSHNLGMIPIFHSLYHHCGVRGRNIGSIVVFCLFLKSITIFQKGDLIEIIGRLKKNWNFLGKRENLLRFRGRRTQKKKWRAKEYRGSAFSILYVGLFGFAFHNSRSNNH